MTAQAKPRVLFVDDEPQVRELACRALDSEGFQCDSACDGDQGLRLVEANAYDAVVTDLRMPVRHGYALCDDILRMSNAPAVVVCTALCESRVVRDLIARGVKEVVNKPVRYDVLALKVRSIIDQRRSARPASSARRPGRSALMKVNLLQQIETSLVELTSLLGDRLDDAFVITGELPDPPRAVRDFIRRLAENDVAHGEKLSPSESDSVLRGQDRVTCYTTVTAAPVSRLGVRNGEPFKLALRDLSESGARLLHTRATNAEYLALCWNTTHVSTRQIKVICQVKRCQPCGPFYDIGGQFVLAD
ncbi:response regulator [Botrimarina sp.]|uniref:response regulator n=1 Tax=Botrimarina sp. TaxID=2795802 RepID=UPI0032EDFFD0